MKEQEPIPEQILEPEEITRDEYMDITQEMANSHAEAIKAMQKQILILELQIGEAFSEIDKIRQARVEVDNKERNGYRCKFYRIEDKAVFPTFHKKKIGFVPEEDE